MCHLPGEDITGCTIGQKQAGRGSVDLGIEEEVLWSPCLDTSELFWQHEGGGGSHNIRQAVLMSWLISVN